MSAPTFETLSNQLTQSLRAQANMPADTTARCTLGRDKVMVLVEYPLEDKSAEAVSIQTLDWLEHTLRDQFDTQGLPDTAADLAENGADVQIQLFLKHASETKPFTMRSFIWKVEDGFDDLFGSAESLSQFAGTQSSGERMAGGLGDYEQPVFHQAGSVSLKDAYEEHDEPVPIELEPMALEDDHLPLELEPEPDFEAELGGHLGQSPNAVDIEMPDVDASNMSAPNIASDIESALAEELTLGLPLVPETASNDAVASESDLASDLEADLAADLSKSLDSDLTSDLATSRFDLGEETEFSLPGEAPDLGDDEFNLPTLDLPGAQVSAIGPADAAFFNVDDVDSAASRDFDYEASTLDLPLPESGFALADELATHDIDSDLDASDLDTPDLNASDLDTPKLDASELDISEPDQDDLNDSDLDAPDLEPPDLDEMAQMETVEPELSVSEHIDSEVAAESGLDESDLSELGTGDRATDDATNDLDNADSIAANLNTQELENDVLADGLSEEAYPEPTLPNLTPPDANYGEDAARSEEISGETEEIDGEADTVGDLSLREYDPEAYEDQYAQARYEDEESYEDDPVYYLDHDEEEEEEELIEEVAEIDEREVQRQREQWQKQSRKNPWIFAGAAGFALVGALAFVATRPCTVGSCDRIQVAQTTSEEAIRDLRIDNSQKSVIATKKQLKNSIRMLKPIPVWSPHYRQARADLPEYESQVRSLDLVAEAQGKAYQAAKDSQNPPHPVKKWQSIANDWLAAVNLLKSVPADSPIKELAESKLTEYRANRATILVRIDAEAKAEVGLIQAQNNAGLGTKQRDAATSAEDWEKALDSWEAAVTNLNQIPQGTNAHAEAQDLLPEYIEQLEEVRARAEREISADESLVEAKQLASAAQRTEVEEQWSVSLDNWRRAYSELQEIPDGTLAYAEAKALANIYAAELSKAESNVQVALQFQTIEPSFFTACGVTATQTCTYSVRGGKIRMDLFEGYDAVIAQSITPPNRRADQQAASNVSNEGATPLVNPQLVGRGTQLLKNITILGTQSQVPIELYDAKGELFATYRPDLEGFTR